jgi:hypothetical protein
MNAAPLGPDTILIATPLPHGTMVLVPRYAQQRSCHRLDGTAKIAFASRSGARRRCAKHEHIYRCKFCGAWHLATTRKRVKGAESPPVTPCYMPLRAAA